MKLSEIKKLSIKEFAERYPFAQVRNYKDELCYYEEDSEYHKKGDPILEFGPNNGFGGWTDLLYCWAEKVKPYYDKLSKKVKESFHITELKEKYGDMRLYLSCFPTEEIKKYTDMAEHLSTYTCLNCGHLTKSSNGKKLFIWRTKGHWVSYNCKDCAKKWLRNDNKDYNIKMDKEEFKQFFSDSYKKVEGDWFARFTCYNKEETKLIAYDCRELLEGMF